jgi:hypothetical protein
MTLGNPEHHYIVRAGPKACGGIIATAKKSVDVFHRASPVLILPFHSGYESEVQPNDRFGNDLD